MLLTEEVEVVLTIRVVKYYEKLEYKIPKIINKQGKEVFKLGETIRVKTLDLSKGSHIKVDVLCDRCKVAVVSKEYRTYLKEMRETGLNSCNECRQKSLPDLFFEKYGVRSTFQMESVKEKSKLTNLERYGEEYPSKSKKVKDKMRQTSMDRYGFDYPIQSPKIQEKIKNTNLKRYGVVRPSQLSIIKEKVKLTGLKRFGKEYYMQTDEYKERSEATSMQKYGFKHYTQTIEHRETCSGENSPLWKGGISSENNKIRGSFEYKQWRIKVFERDNYTCQVCGKRGGKLNAHHLESYADSPELRLNIDNGATVCLEHHGFTKIGSFHKIYGMYHNTKEQFNEYINDYKESHKQLQEEVI